MELNKNNASSLRAKSAYVEKNIKNIYLSGIKYSDLIKSLILKNDLDIYLPISEEKIKKRKITSSLSWILA